RPRSPPPAGWSATHAGSAARRRRLGSSGRSCRARGQGKDERRTLARPRLRPHPPAGRLTEAARDRKPQPSTPYPTAAPPSVERLEDALVVAGRDTGPMVDDPNEDL